MKLNLKNIKENSSDGEFTPITEGRYDLLIEAGQEKTARSGNQMLEFTFKVLGPSFENRKVWGNISLLESAQIYLVRLLEAAGKEDLVKEDVSVDTIIQGLVGQKVSGYIKLRTNSNTGKVGNTVENYAPAMGVESSGDSSSSTPAQSASTTKRALFS